MPVSFHSYSNLKLISSDRNLEGDIEVCKAFNLDCSKINLIEIKNQSEFKHLAYKNEGWYSYINLQWTSDISYCDYTWFRRTLGNIVNGTHIEKVFYEEELKKIKDKPFYYLLYSPDNWGSIYGDAFNKLKSDFNQYNTLITDMLKNNKYSQQNISRFMNIYTEILDCINIENGELLNIA